MSLRSVNMMPRLSDCNEVRSLREQGQSYMRIGGKFKKSIKWLKEASRRLMVWEAWQLKSPEEQQRDREIHDSLKQRRGTSVNILSKRFHIGPYKVREIYERMKLITYLEGSPIERPKQPRPDTRERNRAIAELKNSGHTATELAQRFGLSRPRVYQICAQQYRLRTREQNYGVFFQLQGKAPWAISKASGNFHMTLIDFQKWVESTPDWREKLLQVSGCGTETLRKIEKFAIENGVRITPSQ